WRSSFHFPVIARRVYRKAMTRWPQHRPPEAATFASLGEMYETPHSELGGSALSSVAPGLGLPPDDFDTYDLTSVPSRDDLAQWLRRNEIRGHLEKMLIKVDRASMFESLEVRVPFLDEAVMDVAMRIDPYRCVGKGVGKIPLRNELARHIPSSAISRPKRGFGVPLGDWLCGPLGERFRERVIEHPVIFEDCFDRKGLSELYEAHLSGHHSTQALWNLMSLQEWADRHLKPI
ncbi:MAG: hypothetical protein KDA95_09425, partial [Acidimicrobiales bacterium]|nr:hypothetical protein [Acidimicrobiales bacterium]